MDMPQNEAYENRNLSTQMGKAASHSCYRGSTKFDSVGDGPS